VKLCHINLSGAVFLTRAIPARYYYVS